MPLLTLLLALSTWVWPLPPPVSVVRPFLPPTTAYGPGHRGVDLAGTPGLAVLAAGPGVITVAGPVAGRGVVVVLHGQLRTTYEPVTAEVRVGQVVAGGQRIGTLARGHAGCPRPACLHWGLLRDRTYLDPLSLLGRGPVRLLPLTGTGGVTGTTARSSWAEAASGPGALGRARSRERPETEAEAPTAWSARVAGGGPPSERVMGAVALGVAALGGSMVLRLRRLRR